MNRSRVTGDLASHGNIFVDIANDRVGIGSTIPGQKLSLPDSAKIALGNSADLTIYHDGTNSYVNNTTGTLFYLANTHYFTNPAVSEIQATFVKDGAVKLYHNGSQKFETTAYGVNVTGTTDTDGLVVSGITTTNQLKFADSNGSSTNIALFGDSNDLKIYHNGSHSIVQETGSGGLLILGSVIELGVPSGSEKYFRAVENGAAELYHNNSKKLETTSSGVKFTGVLEAIDNQSILLGTGNDLRIRHTGSHSEITDEGTGNLRLGSNQTEIRSADLTEVQAKFIHNGAVELYHDNSKKLETNSTGIHIFGNTGHADGAADLYGSGNDLSIVHNGTNATIDNDTGDLILRSDADDVKILAEDDIVLRDNDDSTNFIHCINGGAVELYHNGSKKFETTAYGTNTTGTAVNDGLVVAGITTLGGNSTFAANGYFTTNAGITIENSQPGILFNDTTANPDFIIQNRDGSFAIRDTTSAANRFLVNMANGNITATGNIITTGDIKIDNINESLQVGDISNDNYADLRQISGSSYKGLTFQHTNASVLANLQGSTNQFLILGDNDNGNSGTIFGIAQTQSGTDYNYLTLSAAGNLNISNNITLGGTVDGRDIATDGTKLDGIEASATADQTASEILTLIKTVDGSGSGLDADTLDGAQGSQFLRSDSTDTCTGQITFTNQIISTKDGNNSTQGGSALILRHSTNSAMKANHFIHDDFPSGKATYYIQATESGVSNDRNMCLQGYGGKVKIGGATSEPTTTLDVQGTFKVSSTSTFSGDATFSGGAGAITIAAASDIRLGDGAWTGEHGGKIQFHNDYMYFQTSDTDSSAGWIFRDSAGASTLHLNADGSTSGKGLTFGQDVTFNGGGAAATIAAGSDIRFASGNWTGNTCKIQHHGDALYVVGGSNGIRFREGSTDRAHIDGSGNFHPATDSTYSLGTSSLRWTHTYTDALTVTGTISAGGDVTVSGGSGALTVSANSDIRLSAGNWTGDAGYKIQAHSGGLYIQAPIIRLRSNNGSDRWYVVTNGHFEPSVDTTYDIGSSSKRVRNVYGVSFYGSGANITSLNAGNISSGTIAAARFGNNSARESGVSAAGNFGQYESHGTYTNANTEPNFWGWNFSTGSTNFPNSTSSQWYRCRVSLGSDYGKGSDSGDYSMELCYPRNSRESAGQMWTRTIENGSEGSWLEVGSRPYNSVIPRANNTIDLGSSSTRWRNVYTNDLNLSNEGGANDVDGTWGNFTIQEGEDDLFLINKRNGKKYKFNLTEVQ